MLLIVTLSKPVMAMGLSNFTDVPNFSVVIGDSMYTLNYANDPTNINQINAAVVKNKDDIFIKTDDTGWLKNSDSTQANKDSVDISTIKYNNGQIIGDALTSSVAEIDFLSTKLTKTAANEATFKYKILDKAGTNITETVPAYEMIRNFRINSAGGSISLDPLTGTGTITYNFSDPNQFVILQLVCSNGVSATSTLSLGDSKAEDVLDVSDISIVSPNLTKTGTNTTTFQYKIQNKYNIDITKKIPASQIEAVTSVSSTVILDPSAATGTITYNYATDINKPISISLKDKLTGLNVDSALFTPEAVIESPKVSKIAITSSNLGVASGIGYATYSIYDQYGNDVTNSSLGGNVTFQSNIGQVQTKNGLLTITANAGIDLSTLSSVIITGFDSISGVSTSVTLTVK